MKKFLSALLAIVMVITMIPMTAIITFADTTATEISSFSDLEENGNYVLTGNVSMNDLVVDASEDQIVIPAGVTIDGNGFSITGFSLNQVSLMSFSGTATLKNLTFGSSGTPIEAISPKTSGSSMGVIASATSAAVTFENVKVYADITEVSDGTGALHTVGGFVGTANADITFTDCIFDGSITAKSGSAPSGNHRFIIQGGAGGFLGAMSKSDTSKLTVTGCTNYAAISAETNAGGLVGICSSAKMLIQNSTNRGAISAEGVNGGGLIGGLVRGGSEIGAGNLDLDIVGCQNYASVESTQDAGGFVGILYGNSTGLGLSSLQSQTERTAEQVTNKIYAVTISDVTNYGSVSTTSSQGAGGVVGIIFLASSIYVENSANHGSVYAKNRRAGGMSGEIPGCTAVTVIFKNCLNTGAIGSDGDRAGGISGSSDSSVNCYNCINLGAITATSASGIVYSSGGSVEYVIENCLSLGTVTSTGNKYAIGYNITEISDSYYLSTSAWSNICNGAAIGTEKTGVSAVDSLSAALEILNTSTYTDVWGKFMLDSNETGIVLATPRFAGVQRSVENSTVSGTEVYAVRFIATINDTLAYSQVGFEVSINGTPCASPITTNKVYNAVSAMTDNGGISEVTAASLGGTYVYALNITEIPTEGTYTFVITPYANGVADAETGLYETYKLSSYTVVCEDGRIVSVTENATEEV